MRAKYVEEGKQYIGTGSSEDPVYVALKNK